MPGLPRLFILAIFSLCSLACEQKIGDSCDTAVDCTSGSDRICDDSQPGGYCTVFNCEPDACPKESACVGFRSTPSIAPECSSRQGAARLERTFCMLECSDDNDCRAGYACLDFSSFDPLENPWAAEVVDTQFHKVCAVPYSGPQVSERSAESCAAQPRFDAAVPSPVPVPDSGAASDASPADAAGSSVDSSVFDASVADAEQAGPVEAGVATGADAMTDATEPSEASVIEGGVTDSSLSD